MDRYHCRYIYRLISLLRYTIKVVPSYLRAKLTLPAYAPRQLLLHCSTTVRPVRITHFPVGKKNGRPWRPFHIVFVIILNYRRYCYPDCQRHYHHSI